MGNSQPTNKTGNQVVKQVRSAASVLWPLRSDCSASRPEEPSSHTALLLLPTLQKLENAEKLGVLSLSEHTLTEIPPRVFEVRKLRTVDLSRNKLQGLGKLNTLTELKSVNLDHNEFHAGSIGQVSSLQKLQNLSVAHNQLGRPPPSSQAETTKKRIEPLPTLPPSLKQTNVSFNHLLSVPHALCSAQLKKLEKIDLSNNQLAAVPAELSVLTNLQDLSLDHNLITSLPDEIGKLSKLKALSLRQNKLRVTSTVFTAKNPQPLPQSLFTDTLLIDLNLHGNNMTNTQLNHFDGFQDFLDRRQKVKSKTLTDLDVCGLK